MPDLIQRNLADWIVALLLLAFVYMLSRPDGVGAQFLTEFSGAMVALVTAAIAPIGGAAEGATGD